MDKKKKATIYPLKKKKCFQYAVTVALSYKDTKKGLQKNNKNKIAIDKYNWEAINYPSEKDGWGKIEKINPTIVLYAKKEKIYPAYVSEHNSLWKISFSFNDSKREGWHYIAVKNYPHY